MIDYRRNFIPRVGAVLDGFLAVFAPLESILQDFHLAARLNGVSWLPHPLRPFLSRLFFHSAQRSTQIPTLNPPSSQGFQHVTP